MKGKIDKNLFNFIPEFFILFLLMLYGFSKHFVFFPSVYLLDYNEKLGLVGASFPPTFLEIRKSKFFPKNSMATERGRDSKWKGDGMVKSSTIHEKKAEGLLEIYM